MSSSGGGRARLAVAGVLIGLLAVCLLLGRAMTVRYRSQLTCCVRDSRTGGGLALARWAERLGFPVCSLQRPLWEVAEELSEPPVGHCVITAGDGRWSPWEQELSAAKWADIRKWLARGNTLIVVTGQPDRLPTPVKQAWGVPAPTAAVSGSQEPLNWLSDTVPARADTEPAELADRDGGGRALQVVKGGPRWSHLPADWVLAGTDLGAALCRRTVGRGAMYLLLDDFAWTNAGLDYGDNAGVLAAILRRRIGLGGRLAFDEYRHGHGRIESFWSFLIALPGAGSFMQIALLLGALYVYARNVRFGPAVPYEVPERRTAREYIEAVAGMNQRARAAPLALEAVLNRFRYLARRRGHLPPDAKKLLAQAEQCLTQARRPAKPTTECQLVAQLIRLRKELYGTGPDSPTV